MVFSCFNQDQRLDQVDFANLNQRLRGNTVLEKISDVFLARLLQKVAAAQARREAPSAACACAPKELSMSW